MVTKKFLKFFQNVPNIGHGDGSRSEKPFSGVHLPYDPNGRFIYPDLRKGSPASSRSRKFEVTRAAGAYKRTKSQHHCRPSISRESSDSSSRSSSSGFSASVSSHSPASLSERIIYRLRIRPRGSGPYIPTKNHTRWPIPDVPVGVVDCDEWKQNLCRLKNTIHCFTELADIANVTDLDHVKDVLEDHPRIVCQCEHPGSSVASRPRAVFGVSLRQLDSYATLTILLGNRQQHEVPGVLFVVVENLNARGMSRKDLSRIPEDLFAKRPYSVKGLIRFFSAAPRDGDARDSPVSGASSLDLTHLLSEYLSALPEPLLDSSVFWALATICVYPWLEADEEGRVLSLQQEHTAFQCAKLLIRLLPTAHLGPLVYVISFLFDAGNKFQHVSHDRIAEKFGRAICEPRDILRFLRRRGLFKLERGTTPSPGALEQAQQDMIHIEKATLFWLLAHWGKIIDGLFEEDLGTSFDSVTVD